MEIPLGQRLDMGSLAKLANSLASGYSRSVFIDTSQLIWVEPCGIATLLAHVKRMKAAGMHVAVSENVFNLDVERYLQRINFYKTIEIEKDEQFSRKDSSGRFVEADIVNSVTSTDTAADKIAEIFFKDAELKNYMSYMIREIVANGVMHSGCLFGAVVCAQYWPQVGRAQFCVADCGVGFKQHLSSRYNVRTDAEAILLALEKGVTGVLPTVYGNTYNNVGYGLYITKGLVARNGGVLKIISGEAVFTLEKNGERIEDGLSRPWPGVIVSVELVNNNIGRCLQECMADILRESENKPVALSFD